MVMYNGWLPCCCEVAKESGTGYGKVSGGYAERVSTATWNECEDAIDGALA